MKIKILVLVILTNSLISNAIAKKPTIQQRLVLLEQKFEDKILNDTVNSSGVSELVLQNQELQQQISQLQGTIEVQNNQIEQLKSKQKLLYVDLDSRIVKIESSQLTGTGEKSLTNNNGESSQTPNQTVSNQQTTTVASTIVSDVQAPTSLMDFQKDYDLAFAHLRSGRYAESARSFENFIQIYPNNELTVNAYYWLGESYYVKRQYPQALAAFQSLIAKFPNSAKAPDSLLKIGYSYFEMDDYTKAEQSLNSVINNYPNSSVAKLARKRLKQIQRDN